jgi:hypothetical protein
LTVRLGITLRSTNIRNQEVEVITEQPEIEIESDEQIGTSQNKPTLEEQSLDSNQGPFILTL